MTAPHKQKPVRLLEQVICNLFFSCHIFCFDNGQFLSSCRAIASYTPMISKGLNVKKMVEQSLFNKINRLRKSSTYVNCKLVFSYGPFRQVGSCWHLVDQVQRQGQTIWRSYSTTIQSIMD